MHTFNLRPVSRDVDNNGERSSGSNGPKMTRFILNPPMLMMQNINLEYASSMDAIYLIRDMSVTPPPTESDVYCLVHCSR